MSIVVSTVDGDFVDEVTLTDGELAFTTGAAEAMFVGKLANGMTADALYEFYSDWSNGYWVAKDGQHGDGPAAGDAVADPV